MFRKSKKKRADNTTHGQLNEHETSAKDKQRHRKMSQPPGYRPTYNMKTALLKPSFVAVAPSELGSGEQSQAETQIESIGKSRIMKKKLIINNRRDF